MSEDKVYAEGELLKDLQDLTEAVEAETKRMAAEQPPAALVVTDIYEQYKNLLSKKAQAGLEPAIKATVSDRVFEVPVEGKSGEFVQQREVTRCIFLSVMCRREESIPKAVEAICGDVNVLAELGKLRGSLSKLSYIKLAVYASKEEEERANATPSLSLDEQGKLRFRRDVVKPTGTSYAVFCFPHVPAEFNEKLTYAREEGQVGPYIDEVEGA